MRLWTRDLRRLISPWIMVVGICVIAILVDARALATGQVTEEIKGLLDFVEHSDCEFVRNGVEYSGPTARSHLAQKLKYFESKNMVKSAEDFIELAATKSSISGRVYEVRCPGGTEPARLWLHRELQRQREFH